MMLIHAASVAAQAWRNGGGQTRELLVWPAAENWQLRISRADIEADGPFSAFPDVARWFAVLQGAGVALSFADGERVLRAGESPVCFDGAAAPGCKLLDGPTQDLNLMLRGGNGVMRRAHISHSWREAFTMRGVYTTVAGAWRGDSQACDLREHTLLWQPDAGAGAWSFMPRDPEAPGNTWWLGFTPKN